MKIWRFLLLTTLAFCGFNRTAWAENFNIKYSSNYLMPAYVNFQNNGQQYAIQAKINVPFYNIIFSSKGTVRNNQLQMLSYKDSRNGKSYAVAEIDSKMVRYGKVKEPLKSEALTLPTFDLFTMAFQLSYYDKLPPNFQTTNGKKLYPMENVVLNKSVKNLQSQGQTVQEITYKFRTGNKFITVKKWAGEKFPRFISYNRDGDNYELTFSEFVK